LRYLANTVAHGSSSFVGIIYFRQRSRAANIKQSAISNQQSAISNHHSSRLPRLLISSILSCPDCQSVDVPRAWLTDHPPTHLAYLDQLLSRSTLATIVKIFKRLRSPLAAERPG
jgi:hypothetical protein